MPKQKAKNAEPAAAIGKAKLRTAAEVIARLKWSSDEEEHTAQNSIVGYDCRIHGPLEKCVMDFAGISEGGDIPEHRIQYFRLKGDKNYEDLIFWDRLGRVDHLFGSGNQGEAVSPITVANTIKAVENMKRIAEEKAIRAQEKAKRRARQQTKKVAAAAAQKYLANDSSSNNAEVKACSGGDERHVWERLENIFTFDASKNSWIANVAPSCKTNDSDPSKNKELKFITWNVLFDLHYNEDRELVVGGDTSTDTEDTASSRWQLLIDCLATESADIIALQEVTPRFLKQLQSCSWVQERYSLSACEEQLRGIDVYGNLFLWRTESFSACEELHLCRDQHRNRAIVLSLSQANGQILNIANIHLPADKRDAGTGETEDRSQARQRELAAVICKLQVLEQTQQNPNTISIPFILGDFNSGDAQPDSLCTTTLLDSWLHRSNHVECEDGFTFDPDRNSRANRTSMYGHKGRGPRRIDRIFYGNQSYFTATDAHLLGVSEHSLPPSDHYGVSTVFKTSESSSTVHQGSILYNAGQVDHNAWASSALPSTSSLLALVLEDQELFKTGQKLFNLTSTLPIAHITLLNGFVDLSTSEAIILATQAVQDAIRDTLESSDCLKRWTLPVNVQSLSVFEHPSSATLVCLPAKDQDAAAWLNNLYETLRLKFKCCHQQESRFTDGWSAHLSLGKYATTNEARDHLDRLVSVGGWKEDSVLSAFGVGLFRRDARDGKFFNVATVPLVERRIVSPKHTAAFLKTAGAAWSGYMKGASHIVLYELQRACNHVSHDMWKGRLQCSVLLYGSQALEVSLPRISDMDAVACLKLISPLDNSLLVSADGCEFLQLVASRLREVHKSSKIRIRTSSTHGGNALFVLTIKLAPNLPSADLLVARVDNDGRPVDLSSQQALDSIESTNAILASVKNQGIRQEIFQGAVRIVKLWAHRRQIYGSAFGYLGGGGWVTLLAWVLEISNDWKKDLSQDDDAIAARQIAAFFFRNVLSLWSNSNVVALEGTPLESVEHERNNMVIISPKGAGNFGRSSTKSTTAQTLGELRRVAQLLNLSSTDLETCLKLYAEECPNVVVLRIQNLPNSSSAIKPAEAKARGATLSLSLTVALERVLAADQIRLRSEVKRIDDCFWFFIGINIAAADKASYQALSGFVSKQTQLLKQEVGITAELSAMTREEYQHKFES